MGSGSRRSNDRATLFTRRKANSLDWQKTGVEILEGASIGSGAICVAPLKIGRWSLVGAGAVVTKDVKNYALVLGNPARQVGWVGPAGVQLVKISETTFQCPKTLANFELINSELHEIIPK